MGWHRTTAQHNSHCARVGSHIQRYGRSFGVGSREFVTLFHKVYSANVRLDVSGVSHKPLYICTRAAALQIHS